MSAEFIVSARKYRPKRFDEVVGQEATTNTLKNAIKNHQLAHAFLFCGSRGIGKTTIARIFAKTINCKDLQADGEACNLCDSCSSFDKNASFNIIELDGASKNSVDDIREVIEQVQYAPQNAEYKVFIIDEVHMLTSQAFNAFLKTLEEPPSYAKFILATTEKNKILPTILSRCQIYDFKRISINDIQLHLSKIAQKEEIEADDNSLNLIAQKADGGLRDALSMFDRLVSLSGKKLEYNLVIKSLNILDHEVFFKLIQYILNEKSDLLLLDVNEVLINGFDIESILSGFSEHLRNLWVAKRDNTLVLIEYNEEVKAKFVTQSKELDEALILNLLQIIADCEVQLKHTRNRRLVLELSLMKMSYTKKLMNSSWTDLDEKKKSRLSSSTTTPLAIQPSEESIISIPKSTTPSTTKAVGLDDLMAKAELRSARIQIKLELGPITEENIWAKMIENFKSSVSEKQLVQSQQPTIENDTFVFKVESENYGKMLEEQFVNLGKVYSQLTSKLALFRLDLDLSNVKIDLTKKQSFDDLSQKYPILLEINNIFRFDFNA